MSVPKPPEGFLQKNTVFPSGSFSHTGIVQSHREQGLDCRRSVKIFQFISDQMLSASIDEKWKDQVFIHGFGCRYFIDSMAL